MLLLYLLCKAHLNMLQNIITVKYSQLYATSLLLSQYHNTARQKRQCSEPKTKTRCLCFTEGSANPNIFILFSANSAENLEACWRGGEGSLELVLMQDMGSRRVGTQPPAAGIAVTSSSSSKELLVEPRARSREALCCAEC